MEVSSNDTRVNIHKLYPLYNMLPDVIVCIIEVHVEDVDQIWVLFLRALYVTNTFRGIVMNAIQWNMLYIPQNTEGPLILKGT